MIEATKFKVDEVVDADEKPVVEVSTSHVTLDTIDGAQSVDVEIKSSYDDDGNPVNTFTVDGETYNSPEEATADRNVTGTGFQQLSEAAFQLRGEHHDKANGIE